MQEIRQDLIADESQKLSSTDLIAYMLDYVDSRESGGQIEASTATSYRSSIKRISHYLNGYEIGEVTPGSIMDMQAGLLQEGLVPRHDGQRSPFSQTGHGLRRRRGPHRPQPLREGGEAALAV